MREPGSIGGMPHAGNLFASSKVRYDPHVVSHHDKVQAILIASLAFSKTYRQLALRAKG
jgi:hypothetical protein